MSVEALVQILRQPDSSVCLAGELAACSRIEAMDIFKDIGLTVFGTISRKTSFLLAADNAKAEKVAMALSAGVPVFTEQEFWEAMSIVHPSHKGTDSNIRIIFE